MMRDKRAATVGVCATCEGVRDRRADARVSDALAPISDADAFALWGTRSVYRGRDGRALFGLAWCARENNGAGAYHVTALPGSTTAIRARDVVRGRGIGRIGRSLGYCDRCGVARDDHDVDDRARGCIGYKGAQGAIARRTTITTGAPATVAVYLWARRTRDRTRATAIAATITEGAGL